MFKEREITLSEAEYAFQTVSRIQGMIAETESIPFKLVTRINRQAEKLATFAEDFNKARMSVLTRIIGEEAVKASEGKSFRDILSDDKDFKEFTDSLMEEGSAIVSASLLSEDHKELPKGFIKMEDLVPDNVSGQLGMTLDSLMQFLFKDVPSRTEEKPVMEVEKEEAE